MQQQDDLIGTMLGNYRILSPIGQGGMARVYKAYQENLDREVAIKVLPPWYAADRSFVERFNLEARLVARLSHPNIVTVHDANEQNKHLYIVMQYIEGGTLKNRMDALLSERKVMDTTEVVAVFTQLADALTYAHEQGIIHRDIKPVNVLMDHAGRPILSDFGIAKVLASSQMHLTHPGAGVGTPEYMSPEQCQGGSVDGRADIYALGVMLFEAQTGYTPFRNDNYPALAHSHIYEAPPRPRSLNPNIHPAIEHVILKALMKHPQQRFQKASEMIDALKLALTLDHPTASHPTTSAQAPAHNARLSQAPAYHPGLSAARYSVPPHGAGQYGSPPLSAGYTGQASPDSRQVVMYPCFHCQALNKPQMRFCTRCGTPMNRCNICGERNPASNRFCTKCGQPLVM